MRHPNQTFVDPLPLLMAFVGGMILGATFCERGLWTLLGW